ncbi:MAG: sensor histidine kinase [Actinomycetota bacterium]
MSSPAQDAPPSSAGLRFRLVLLVLLAVLPALALVAFETLGIAGLAIVGVLAVAIAWFVGTTFVERPVAAAFRRERDAVSRLEEVDRMRTDFVSMISHELRNPLATIRGFGQLLRDRPESLPGEQRIQAYEAIVRQVDRMAALVDNVLDVSRLESDTFTYAFISFDPRRFVAECAEEARTSWPAHEIVVHASSRLPEVAGDADRLKQVVMNLVSNACRYSPAGAAVTMRAWTDGSNLRIAVLDRGAGIAPEDVANLFQRFARLRTPDTQKVRGTGLGLYISKKIVEAHGGRILVDSEPGRGSTFTLELPLRPPQPDA